MDSSPIARIDDGLLSISCIARESGRDRKTIAKLIDAAGITPSGMARGYPTYRLRDVLKILVPVQGDRHDPAEMTPMERRAWYQSENERIKFETDCGHLIPKEEVIVEMAAMAKIVVQVLETMPDVFEQRHSPNREVSEYLIETSQKMRALIYEKLSAATAPEQLERADQL